MWGCLGALPWGQRLDQALTGACESGMAPVWGAAWVLLPRIKGHFLCLLIEKQKERGSGRCS